MPSPTRSAALGWFRLAGMPGGYVAYHDYADYYPGVQSLVDEVLGRAEFHGVCCVRSLAVLRKRVAE